MLGVWFYYSVWKFCVGYLKLIANLFFVVEDTVHQLSACAVLYCQGVLAWPGWSRNLSLNLLNVKRVWNSGDFWWGMLKATQVVFQKLMAWSRSLTILPALLLRWADPSTPSGQAVSWGASWALVPQTRSVHATDEICVRSPSGSCSSLCLPVSKAHKLKFLMEY